MCLRFWGLFYFLFDTFIYSVWIDSHLLPAHVLYLIISLSIYLSSLTQIDLYQINLLSSRDEMPKWKKLFFYRHERIYLSEWSLDVNWPNIRSLLIGNAIVLGFPYYLKFSYQGLITVMRIWKILMHKKCLNCILPYNEFSNLSLNYFKHYSAMFITRYLQFHTP